MERTIHFAIAGYGNIGKRHAAILRSMPGASLCAVIDPGLGRPPELDGIPCFNSLEDFLAEPLHTDVVIIATPNGYHIRHAMQCIDAGKHVVIEKPLALTKGDAEKLVFKALGQHKLAFVVMQNRYSAPVIWLKQLLDAGTLGKICMVQLNCFWNRDERYYTPDSWHGTRDLDGGTLFTQFSHFIDILYWLFGEIQDIKARFANFNHSRLTEFEDCGLVNFELASGGIGSLSFSTSVWDRNFESSMTILAENGTIRIGGQYMDEVSYCHIRDYTLPTEGINDGQADRHTNHRKVLENVISVLNGNGSVGTNAMEGLKVVEIIENIYAANTITTPETMPYEEYK